MVTVPDERVDWLGKFYEKDKIVHSHIEFVDIPGSVSDSTDPKIVAAAHETDALVCVIRAFENPNVPHPHETVDPLRDYGYINMGLITADMSIAEKRIEKLDKSITKGAGTPEEKLELEVLKKVMAQLEVEESAADADLNEQEDKLIRAFQFLTLKPQLALINVSEGGTETEDTKKLLGQITNSMALCADLEMELLRLNEADREAYMKDIGMRELSLNSFIRKAHETLGLISFFTVGEKEVRAWTIPRGTPAHAAAGKIHTDMEHGFIRADVFSFDDLKAS